MLRVLAVAAPGPPATRRPLPSPARNASARAADRGRRATMPRTDDAAPAAAPPVAAGKPQEDGR
jgi:hypothetical protein